MSTVTLNCAAVRYVLWSESDTEKTCPDLPARATTAIQFPTELFDLNAKVEEEVEPASLLVC